MPEYPCDVCGAIFQTRVALERHKDIFHAPEEDEVGAVGDDGEAVAHRRGQPVVFRCGFCGAAFARHAQLQEHLPQHVAEREERTRERERRLSGRVGRGRAPRARARRALKPRAADEGNEEVA